ncbi:hypothetical protein ACEQ8H_004215 [Pleosporales sp. CAS-2024a]
MAVRLSSTPISIVPTPSEVQDGTLSPRNLEIAVRALSRDGLVIIDNLIQHPTLDRLNAKMTQDAYELQGRKDSPFNYNKGNIQQDPPMTREWFSPSIFTNFDHPDIPFALVVNIPLVDTSVANGATELWLVHFAPWYRNGMTVEVAQDLRECLTREATGLQVAAEYVSTEEVEKRYLNRPYGNAYDFDQLDKVTGGTAGCLLANRLAHSAARPSVLVLEAGSKPDGEFLTAPYHRAHPLMFRPDLDHGYMSEPEPALNGRQIAYTRGKGLGGSSILNFGVYLYGSKEDWNRWGDEVGDDDWKWASVEKSYHEIETYEVEGKEYAHLADPSAASHGKNGGVKVGLLPDLEKGVVAQMEALVDAGEEINLDPNSGNPIGLAIFPMSYNKQGRCTSAMAHLMDAPSNLEVWTGATVKTLAFEGHRVVGVETIDGRAASASKEVILCSGALDTPKLLLLNGIGPKAELESLGIEVKKDLPGVGKHLQDHVMTTVSVEVDGAVNDRGAFESDPELVAEAQKLWDQDRSGALALQSTVMWGGFHKLPGLQDTPEFQSLSEAQREFLNREAVPAYEYLSGGILWPPGTKLDKGSSYMTMYAFLMNPQSEGSVTLRSKAFNDKPMIKLNYLSHPYDAMVLREAIRSLWNKITANPVIAPSIKKTLYGPASTSDEDIDGFIKEAAGTVWHANGTVKMGKAGEKGACVDSGGRVYGVQGLRVADVSVCPHTTNNHTQATAYLVGQKIGEKMIREYGLEKGLYRPDSKVA